MGLVAPNNVVVPLGNTGLDPSQTSFFQARAYLGKWEGWPMGKVDVAVI